MKTKKQQRNLWAVGASFGGTKDVSQEFISQGIWYDGHASKGSNKNKKYLDKVKVGDILIMKSSATKGSRHSVPFTRIKAIGEVVDKILPHKFKVNWYNIEGLPKDLDNVAYRKTIEPVRKGDIIYKYVTELIGLKDMTELEGWVNLLKSNKNLVLTGAPGTGKTYLAKQMAAYMVAGKDHYDDLTAEEKEQIGFVQFHPSYDYTDFVEGLRPVMKENGQLGFELKDGTFKAFCKKAKEDFWDEEKAKHDFDIAWEKLLNIVRENEKKGKKTKIGAREYGLSNVNSLKFIAENAPSKYPHTITKQNIFDIYRNQQARPSRGGEVYMKQILSFMKENLGLKDYNKNGKTYVFIIDEINRAEISKVFGELFFAIDPGYRGEKGKVKTQYANMDNDEYFYVPENVYIIGTMNDIDRSVDTFDFAMRRRFAWKEILAEDRLNMWDGQLDEPQKEEAGKRLRSLNRAIESEEIGLNKSYHIGPAYFLKLKNYDENPFEELWNNHLEILLREYLRGMPGIEKKMEILKKTYNLENQSDA